MEKDKLTLADIYKMLEDIRKQSTVPGVIAFGYNKSGQLVPIEQTEAFHEYMKEEWIKKKHNGL